LDFEIGCRAKPIGNSGRARWSHLRDCTSISGFDRSSMRRRRRLVNAADELRPSFQDERHLDGDAIFDNLAAFHLGLLRQDPSVLAARPSATCTASWNPLEELAVSLVTRATTM
jgi:hypothetical protein